MNERSFPLLAEPSETLHESLHEQFWAVAILLFGVGDLVTTGIGLHASGVSELGPLTAPLVHQYGVGVIVAMKVVALGGFYVLWRVAPRPHCVGVPLGLAIVGVSVTAWNLFVLGVATLV